MATSGSITKAGSGSASWCSVTLSWTSGTVNIPNNTTAINWELKLSRTYAINSSSSKAYSVNINGSVVASGSTTISGSGSKVIASGTVNIKHGNDGKASFALSFSQVINATLTGTYVGTLSNSDTHTLDDIPRISTVEIGNFNIGSNPVITVNRASTAFQHDFSMYFGATGSGSGDFIGDWFIGNPSGNSSPIIDLNSTHINRILDRMPTTTSATVRIMCRTWFDGVYMGATYDTATVTIPNTVTYKPSISSITATINGSGRDNAIEKFIQNISKANVVTNYSLSRGTSLRNIRVTVDGVAYSGASITTNTLLNLGSEIPISVTVEDSRKRSITDTTTIYVHGYDTPRITHFSGNRSSTGNSINLFYRYDWNRLATDNPLTFKIERRVVNSADWTVVTQTTGITTYLTDVVGYQDTQVSSALSYEYRMIIKDYVQSIDIPSVTTVGTAHIGLTIGETGAAAGKVYEGLAGFEVHGGIISDEYISQEIPSNSNLNNYQKVGFYYNPRNADAINISNTPVDRAFSLLVEKHAGIKQTFTTYDANNVRIFVRNRYGSSWGSWIELTEKEIEESGGTANGSYIRYSDGTQICYMNIDSAALASGNSTHTWVFPAQFIDVRYHLDMKIWAGNTSDSAKLNYIRPSRGTGTTRSQGQVYVNMTSAHSYSIRLSWFAVGRWK